MVRAGVEYVRDGDVFQVNLAQRFTLAAAVDPVAAYAAARRTNPAPCAGYFAAGPRTIVSMSPERFPQAGRGRVRMHPINGTRRVLASPEADLFAGSDLAASAKDRAENVMIVDLVRNDLARVCRPESVRVEALCRLERYRYVQHLVSVVSGRLLPGLGGLDAFEAAIPGGSVSGAPKDRACEVISPRAMAPAASTTESFCKRALSAALLTRSPLSTEFVRRRDRSARALRVRQTSPLQARSTKSSQA